MKKLLLLLPAILLIACSKSDSVTINGSKWHRVYDYETNEQETLEFIKDNIAIIKRWENKNEEYPDKVDKYIYQLNGRELTFYELDDKWDYKGKLVDNNTITVRFIPSHPNLDRKFKRD